MNTKDLSGDSEMLNKEADRNIVTASFSPYIILRVFCSTTDVKHNCDSKSIPLIFVVVVVLCPGVSIKVSVLHVMWFLVSCKVIKS